MSLDYHLELENQHPEEELFSLLIQQCGFTQVSEEVVKNGNLIAGISKSRPGPSTDVINAMFQKACGFAPKARVWFQLSKTADTRAEHDIILRSAVTLLENLPDDAVLLFNSEITVLWRIKGQLEFDTKWNEGKSLEGFPPHNLRSLPCPLLQ
jgi:hypothetical protein